MIQALSIGITESEFWKLTPFQLYIKTQAYYEKIKKDNIINIRTYNTVRNLFGDNGIEDFDDIFGVDKQNVLQPHDFGSVDEYLNYLKSIQKEE